MNNRTFDKVVSIIRELKEFEDIDAGDLLIDSGMLDSFDIINMIMKLEEEFQIGIPGPEIIPENLNTVPDIVNLVEKVLSAQKK